MTAAERRRCYLIAAEKRRLKDSGQQVTRGASEPPGPEPRQAILENRNENLLPKDGPAQPAGS